MKINSLSFQGYRNLKTGSFSPSGQVNVIYGSNAQGKTNLLEAIWIFTGGRSFRGAKDGELTAFGETKARLSLHFFAQQREQEAEIFLENGKRKIFLNEIRLKSPSAMVGNFCSVIFSPSHLSLVKDGPGERRKFLDAAICQYKPSYAVALGRFHRGILQRNALLKEIYRRPYLEETLEVWDEKLSQLGSVIIEERLNYLSVLQPQAEYAYEGFSQGRERLRMEYQSACIHPGEKGISLEELQTRLQAGYAGTRKEDLRAGFTSIGPHRDDLSFLLDEKSARSYGSQGQQRSVVLALKLSEAEALSQAVGERPVVLLDDVMSELDTSRQDYILNHMESWQVFVTCCDPVAILRMTGGKAFEMADGILTEKNGD